jgi:uncharacterized protein
MGRSPTGARRHRQLTPQAHGGPARAACRGALLIALDTSALTKLVVQEPETPALIAALRGQALLASELVRTELRRAVIRTAPEQLEATDALLGRLLLVRLDAALLDAAGRLCPPALRTLDAIHLQSALLVGDELDALITYDVRHSQAARDAGLSVRAPV